MGAPSSCAQERLLQMAATMIPAMAGRVITERGTTLDAERRKGSKMYSKRSRTQRKSFPFLPFISPLAGNGSGPLRLCNAAG